MRWIRWLTVVAGVFVVGGVVGSVAVLAASIEGVGVGSLVVVTGLLAALVWFGLSGAGDVATPYW